MGDIDNGPWLGTTHVCPHVFRAFVGCLLQGLSISCPTSAAPLRSLALLAALADALPYQVFAMIQACTSTLLCWLIYNTNLGG
jgi:hypothetical protein